MGLLILVRHGQASFGAEDYDQLSELGFEQARLLGARLAASATPIDRVVSGSLRRQSETAAAISESLDLTTPPAIRQDLDEFDTDEGIGRDPTEYMFDSTSSQGRARVNEMMAGEIERWANNQGTYVETHSAFITRIATEVEELALAPGNTLAVTSCGVVSAVAAQLLEADTAKWIAINRVIVNASLTKVAIGRTGRTLLNLNDHAHLEHDRRLITYR
ncbi:MAG: hypothetical protein JWM76_5062 [Pseudonocardiales bacterium]|nr:hypothetical protein [Pseudonocardiales bacterium]